MNQQYLRFDIWFILTLYYKYDRHYYKMGQLFYYKMRQNLIAKCVRCFVTKCDSFITKFDSYCKMRQFYYKIRRSLQNAPIQTAITNFSYKIIACCINIDFLINKKQYLAHVVHVLFFWFISFFRKYIYFIDFFYQFRGVSAAPTNI